MTRALLGLVASVFLLGAGDTGQGSQTRPDTPKARGGTGSANTADLSVTGAATGGSSSGSGSLAPAVRSPSRSAYLHEGASTADAQELTGTVTKLEGKTLHVQQDGKPVVLTLSSQTRFEGLRSARELKEGQQVRASVVEQDEDKVVLRLSGTAAR